MLKDGSSWGAHAGVTAALIARKASPARRRSPSIAPRNSGAISGSAIASREQYFKAYPVCRWAQPAIEAALALAREHRFVADDIAAIAIESFREAIDLGSRCPSPATHDEAQYSLPIPWRPPSCSGRWAQRRSMRRIVTIRALRVFSRS
jgi:2-methylcitrate dehydratase PrpD